VVCEYADAERATAAKARQAARARSLTDDPNGCIAFAAL
jgi:hypothetical protein